MKVAEHSWSQSEMSSNNNTMIERLVRLVSTKSLSREEDSIAGLLYADLQHAGLKMHRKGNNLWCEVGDANGPRLLLNSHLDTVPPADGWSNDPWAVQCENGRITGLGANDAKGCVTAMVEAVLAAKKRIDSGQQLGGAIVLALTAQEEISGAGLAAVIDDLGPLDAAIIGEPTSLVPMTAQRGVLIIQGIAHGRSGHPANTPADSADNAILTAARDLVRLESFDWGPEHPLLGRCHAHATMIEGGVARNVIPNKCRFYLDIRTTPVESHEDLCNRLRSHLQSELHVHSDRLVPKQTDDTEPIVKAALRAVPGTVSTGSPAMSDMVFLGKIPGVKIGPGDTRRSHTADEFILVEELQQGAAAYDRIIQEYFIKGPNNG